MDVLAKAQTMVTEHALTIGIVLLVVVLLAGVVWYSMSRPSTKAPELENLARVNQATTAPPHEQLPTQEQLEEMANYANKMESQQPADNSNE